MSAIMDCEFKNVHYTGTERMLLAQLISEEKIIENKRTGATDLKDKAEAWERIVKRYCSEGCTPRTNKQLKKCWDNMKQKYSISIINNYYYINYEINIFSICF